MFDVFYYGGLAACGIQGTDHARQSPVPPAFFLLISIASAFGGGFIRDSLLLRTYPAVFTREAIPGIVVAVIAGCVFLLAQTKSKYAGWINVFSLTSDALGLGTFIAYGIDNANAKGASFTVTILSGTITALGGGIICSIACGTPVCRALSANVLYKFITIIGSLLYWICQVTYGTWIAHGIIIIYTGVTVLVANREVRHHIIRALHYENMFMRFISPYKIISYILISISKYYINTFFGDVHQNDSRALPPCMKIRLLMLLLHRWRLMCS